MNDLTVATPDPIAKPATPEAIEAPTSIADHASEFGPEAKSKQAEPPPVQETPAQAQQRRDRETGQFKEGRVRHRAKSQQASAEDVPRIKELTAKQRAAEERAAAAEAELARYRQGGQQASAPRQEQAPQQNQPAQPAHGDPEPQDTDEKYATNYTLYLNDHARWAARDEYRQIEQQRQAQQAQQQIASTWSGRAKTIREKYADFDQVALMQPVPWQPGSVVDQFIIHDDAGPEILYYLQSNPAERDSLGQMTVLQASKHLSLLSQRLLSSSPASAGTNGAATRANMIVLPPKPSTPLRTEAQRGTPADPPTDGSLSIAEHSKHFGKASRR